MMKQLWTFAVVAVSCIGVTESPAWPQIPCAYEITHIIEPPPCQIGGTNLFPTAISPSGQFVCGYYTTCLSFNNKSFVYDTTTKQFISIPNPPGIAISSANDVNDAGFVVGEHGGLGGDFGYIYDLNTGQFTNIPPAIDDGTCVITSINAKGSVCGWRSIGEPLDNIYNAFIWTKEDGVTDLGVMNGPRSVALSINNRNVVVGYTGSSLTALDLRGFVHENGKTTVFDAVPGALNSNALFVDNSKRIVIGGKVQSSPVFSVGYLYDDGAVTQLLPANPFPTLQLRGMNNNQLVVGNSGNGSFGTSPTVWINTIPINFALLTPPIEEFVIDYGSDVSDTGVIVARGATFGAPRALVLTPVERVNGDADCDTDVDVDDLIQVINHWGECAGCGADFIVDGIINVEDLTVVIDNWSTAP